MSKIQILKVKKIIWDIYIGYFILGIPITSDKNLGVFNIFIKKGILQVIIIVNIKHTVPITISDKATPNTLKLILSLNDSTVLAISNKDSSDFYFESKD